MADIKANRWKIEYQAETVALGPDGRAQEGVKVAFVTELGNHGSVFMPRALYSTANVQASVAQAAAQMDEIHQLRGG